MKRTQKYFPTSVRLSPENKAIVERLSGETGWSESLSITRLLELGMLALKEAHDAIGKYREYIATETAKHRVAILAQEQAKRITAQAATGLKNLPKPTADLQPPKPAAPKVGAA